MGTKQVNLKLSKKLYTAAESFAESYGYRNVQELAADSLREKIFEKSDFDESFSEKEIGLIDRILEKTIKRGKLVNPKEYFKEFQENPLATIQESVQGEAEHTRQRNKANLCRPRTEHNYSLPA